MVVQYKLNTAEATERVLTHASELQPPHSMEKTHPRSTRMVLGDGTVQRMQLDLHLLLLCAKLQPNCMADLGVRSKL